MFTKPSGSSLPIKDCAACLYSKDKQGGHCYMFKNEPEGDFCGAFKRNAVTVQRAAHIAVLSLMEELSVSQSDLANRMEISRSAVSQMFEQAWTLDRFQAIAEALGASVQIKLKAPSEEQPQ